MLILVVVFWAATSPNIELHVNSQSVFEPETEHPSQPVSDLSVALEFRGALFWGGGLGRMGCRGRRGSERAPFL